MIEIPPVPSDIPSALGRERYFYERGWDDAIKLAAQIADECDHHGDEGVAMYAAPRIRDRIKRLLRWYKDGMV